MNRIFNESSDVATKLIRDALDIMLKFLNTSNPPPPEPWTLEYLMSVTDRPNAVLSEYFDTHDAHLLLNVAHEEDGGGIILVVHAWRMMSDREYQLQWIVFDFDLQQKLIFTSGQPA